MDMETFPTSNVAVQTMICSLLLQTAQKSLLSLLFMIEFLSLYPDLVGVEKRYREILFFRFLFVCCLYVSLSVHWIPKSYYRFPFGELKRAMAPDNRPKDSSETDDDNDENEDDEDTDNDEEDDDEGSDDDDEEDSDGDDADANEGSDDDSDDEDDDGDSDDDDEDDEEEDDEEEDNQPPYRKIK